MQQIVIFGDGGSRGNPGPAACGFVIKEGRVEIADGQIVRDRSTGILFEQGKFLGNTTNNVAEWESLKEALIYVSENLGKNLEIQVCMDSNLVVQQIQGKWQVKQPHLKPYLQEVSQLSKQFAKISYFHIYREFNKEADKLVNEVLDKM